MFLSENVRIVRLMNAVAAGTSDQDGTGIDMQGWDGVMFIALLGTLSASQVTSMKVQQSSDDGSADAYTDVEGSDSGNLDDDDDNDQIVIDILRPEERYLRPVLLRGTGNAVIDGIVAIQYKARETPITDHSTVVKIERLSSPVAGTA